MTEEVRIPVSSRTSFVHFWRNEAGLWRALAVIYFSFVRLMNPLTVDIYHNRQVSHTEIESLFVPIFGHVYSYSILLNMSDHIWCAYSNDQLIGCVLAKQSNNSSILYLILFGIEKLYRSLGIGTSLLSTIIEYTRRCVYTRIYLHTECTNASAISFYRKFHFQIDLYVENYYQTMTTFYPDAFRMSRKLHSIE